jgi:hypothetical protein
VGPSKGGILDIFINQTTTLQQLTYSANVTFTMDFAKAFENTYFTVTARNHFDQASLPIDLYFNFPAASKDHWAWWIWLIVVLLVLCLVGAIGFAGYKCYTYKSDLDRSAHQRMPNNLEIT